MTPDALEAGYWRAYRQFYTWGSIFRGACANADWRGRLRHFAYASAWKKFEPMWDFIIRTKRVARMLPLLETILDGANVEAKPGFRTTDSGSTVFDNERGIAQHPVTRPNFASADFFD
jgi:hypothetical protein